MFNFKLVSTVVHYVSTHALLPLPLFYIKPLLYLTHNPQVTISSFSCNALFKTIARGVRSRHFCNILSISLLPNTAQNAVYKHLELLSWVWRYLNFVIPNKKKKQCEILEK